LIVLLTFSIPLVALYRGDMSFVSKYMDLKSGEFSSLFSRS